MIWHLKGPIFHSFFPGYFFRSYGQFDSDETMSFVIDMPYNSGRGLLVPSANGGATPLGDYSVNGYAYFEAPSLQKIQFSNTGEATVTITVTHGRWRPKVLR